MRKHLETCFNKPVSTNSLCDLASIILKNNYFQHRELKYHKKIVTAIGNKFAPLYSSLFMARFEKRIFQTVSLNILCVYDTLMSFFVYGP